MKKKTLIIIVVILLVVLLGIQAYLVRKSKTEADSIAIKVNEVHVQYFMPHNMLL